MSSYKAVRPFLKWAGGKSQLFDTLHQYLPQNLNKYSIYIEPFVGAGAFFFNIINNDSFNKYIINDINSKLIELYKCIRDNVDELIIELELLKNRYNDLLENDEKSKYYYECREAFNEIINQPILQSALFIFLNKTCFNGLYRENSKGKFNVPFNNAKSPSFYDEEVLREISRKLNLKDANGLPKVIILNQSYESLIQYVNEKTFIYFDPPYRPITRGGFNTYSKSGFNDDNQLELSKFYTKCHELGALLMLSNSDPKNLDKDDDFFDLLYKDYKIRRVSALRSINSKSSGRGYVNELLITNYGKKENDIIMNDYVKSEETFQFLMETLKDSIRSFDYFVNWDKVYKNIEDVEIALNIMNSLIGKPEEELETRTYDLLKKYPECIKTIPILVASREDNFKILNSVSYDDLSTKSYLFNKKNEYNESEIYDIIEFMKKTKLFEIFSSERIKNLVDYVFGVEVGLDSNGRKNRSGHAMEDLVEFFVAKMCENKGFRYLKEATPKVIKNEWNYEVSVDKTSRRFDFAIDSGSKLYLIETNYYSGGGSKLKATCGEYKTLFDYTKNDGHVFIWVTDGKGWSTAHLPLHETFNHNDYILNLVMLEQGILENIVI